MSSHELFKMLVDTNFSDTLLKLPDSFISFFLKLFLVFNVIIFFLDKKLLKFGQNFFFNFLNFSLIDSLGLLIFFLQLFKVLNMKLDLGIWSMKDSPVCLSFLISDRPNAVRLALPLIETFAYLFHKGVCSIIGIMIDEIIHIS